MNQPIPPILPATTVRSKPTRKNVILVWLVVLLVGIFTFVIFPIIVAAIMGVSLFSAVWQTGEIHVQSNTGKFHVTVLELKSEPDYFMERVRIKCERDMEVNFWVTDLKEAGFLEVTDTNGLIFYREGHPHQAGFSVPVRADGKYSTCDILFQVNTTSTNTVWHSRVSTASTNTLWQGETSSSGLNTTFPLPLTVSQIQTNWPGAYERGSAIPLADLGDYKILISAK